MAAMRALDMGIVAVLALCVAGQASARPPAASAPARAQGSAPASELAARILREKVAQLDCAAPGSREARRMTCPTARRKPLFDYDHRVDEQSVPAALAYTAIMAVIIAVWDRKDSPASAPSAP